MGRNFSLNLIAGCCHPVWQKDFIASLNSATKSFGSQVLRRSLHSTQVGINRPWLSDGEICFVLYRRDGWSNIPDTKTSATMVWGAIVACPSPWWLLLAPQEQPVALTQPRSGAGTLTPANSVS